MTTTIVVSPLGRQEESTGEVISLDIFVKDPALFSTYDKIEVWRAAEQGGPYSELTAAEVSRARLPAGASSAPVVPVSGPSVILDTLELELLVNELVELSVVFAGADPISYGDAAAQVVAQGQGLVNAYVTSLGIFVVETTGVGTAVSLRVLSSDGAAQLDLPVDELVYGRVARLNLCDGVERYVFEDLFGSGRYFYKIRFRNASTGAVSEFSLPHSIGSRVGTAFANLICGQANLLRADGRPLVNQLVEIRAEFTGMLVDGAVMAGTTLAKTTDVNGHVEFVLLRGQKFGVSVPGTSLFRDITVPTDPDKQTFNLFDPDIAGEDIFKVQVPEIVVAERRTL